MMPTKSPPRATAATSKGLPGGPGALPGGVAVAAPDGVLQAVRPAVALAERQPDEAVLVVHDLFHGGTKPRAGRCGTEVAQNQLGEQAEPVDRRRSGGG